MATLGKGAVVLKEWFILRTRSRQESTVEQGLKYREIACYLPRRQELRQWSDRKKSILAPLFAGYLFVDACTDRLSDLRCVPGACGLVQFNNIPARLEDAELDRFRRLIDSGIPVSAHPELIPGMAVVVRTGVLAGLEGELVQIKNRHRLVINAIAIGKSVSFEIDASMVERKREKDDAFVPAVASNV
jgi:transcriptional antiterminator RfaH